MKNENTNEKNEKQEDYSKLDKEIMASIARRIQGLRCPLEPREPTWDFTDLYKVLGGESKLRPTHPLWPDFIKALNVNRWPQDRRWELMLLAAEKIAEHLGDVPVGKLGRGYLGYDADLLLAMPYVANNVLIRRENPDMPVAVIAANMKRASEDLFGTGGLGVLLAYYAVGAIVVDKQWAGQHAGASLYEANRWDEALAMMPRIIAGFLEKMLGHQTALMQVRTEIARMKRLKVKYIPARG